MDLSGIEAWTRELLDAVARKRGIRNPEFRRRGELVRLLLRQHYGNHLQAGRERVARGVHAAGQARQLMGKVVGSALEALPEAIVALFAIGVASETRGSATKGPSGRAAPRPAPNAGQVARPTDAASQQASTRTFIEQPVRTRAMARSLAAQGYRERALAIYAELLDHARDDHALQAEADAVGRGERVPASLAPAQQVRPARWQLPAVDDGLLCEGEPGSGLSLHWRITEAGLRRARAVLGDPGELVVRVVSIERDPVSVVRSAITEHGPVALTGAWGAPALPNHAHCFAAVGVRAGGRFVAIVHARPKGKAAVRAAHSAVSAHC